VTVSGIVRVGRRKRTPRCRKIALGNGGSRVHVERVGHDAPRQHPSVLRTEARVERKRALLSSVVVAVIGVVAVVALLRIREEQSPSSPPEVPRRLLGDTSKRLADTSRSMKLRSRKRRASPVERAIGGLSPGQVRYEGPDTMVVASAATVSVKVAREAQFAATPTPSHGQVVTAPTRVGDSAKVCLGADSADFRISMGLCATQPITSDTNNVWSWLVTPLRAGKRLLHVRVEALLARLPGKAVFDSSYTVVVAVAPRTLGERAKSWLTTTKVILAAIAAILTSIVLIRKKLHELFSRLTKKRRQHSKVDPPSPPHWHGRSP